jgi:hypothetical protein
MFAMFGNLFGLQAHVFSVQILIVSWLQFLLDGKGGAYTSTLEQYRVKAEYFLCAALQKNNGANIKRSPGKMLGILYKTSLCLEEEKHKLLDRKERNVLLKEALF